VAVALHHPSRALAGLIVFAVFGAAVAVVAIGLATLSLAAVTVMTWFAVVLLILLAGVAVLARRRLTSGPSWYAGFARRCIPERTKGTR
jgi:hypothetical protein